MVAIGVENSWFRDLDQGVQGMHLYDKRVQVNGDNAGRDGVGYMDLYHCETDDELEEMNRMVKLEISKLEYSLENDGDDSVDTTTSCSSPSSTLLTNSSYNLIESNWHSANQDYHKFYKEQLLKKQQNQHEQLTKKGRRNNISNQIQKSLPKDKQQRTVHPQRDLKQYYASKLQAIPPVPHLEKSTTSEETSSSPLVLSSSIISIPVGSRFFVIKSFNQQDINSSFIHKIWSSTDLGNNRLAKAFNNKYPSERIFLLFSVNGSGKFCGVAEMKSSLRLNPDGHANESVWLDGGRWKGNFKIQWLIIKDITNLHFKHLKFQAVNNFTNTFEMKPVTNSRDTQELTFEVGRQMINIFKETPSSTSFLQTMVSSK